MPQTITTSVQALVDATEREIETLNAEQAVALHGRDDVVFVDLRDTRELQREGKVPGCRERHLSESLGRRHLSVPGNDLAEGLAGSSRQGIRRPAA
jgi:hypothetical protein